MSLPFVDADSPEAEAARALRSRSFGTFGATTASGEICAQPEGPGASAPIAALRLAQMSTDIQRSLRLALVVDPSRRTATP
jgi:hypothetical protein